MLFWQIFVTAGEINHLTNAYKVGKGWASAVFRADILVTPNSDAITGGQPLTKNDSSQIIRDDWFSYDKGYHLLGSFMLTVAGTKTFQEFTDKNAHSSKVWAVSITLAFGLGKELYDSTRMINHFSFKDLIADIVGITLGLVVLNND